MRPKLFNELEESILLQIINNYKTIIQDKSGDKINILRKNKAWTDIASQYNSNLEVTKRDLKQLQVWWKNSKAQAKKQVGIINPNGNKLLSLH